MLRRRKTSLSLEDSNFRTAISSTPRVLLDSSTSSSTIPLPFPRKFSCDYSDITGISEISRQDSKSTDDTVDDKEVSTFPSSKNGADEVAKASLIHLPNKFWLQILDYLTIKEISTVTQASNHLREKVHVWSKWKYE